MEELQGWEEAFYAFHARFADLFARRESREQAGQYLRGLLGPVERKNGWQMGEGTGQRRPDSLERVLYLVDWDEDEARDRLQTFIVEKFGEADELGVLDETSFLKKGTHSAGSNDNTAGRWRTARSGCF